VSLANHAELVHMDRVQPGTRPLGRLSNVPGAYSGIWWYADFPDHYAGDAGPATVEKGLKLRELQVNALAKFIKAVKDDTVTPTLEKEFFEREAALRK
jgi:creatinine amidohydrolase